LSVLLAWMWSFWSLVPIKYGVPLAAVVVALVALMLGARNGIRVVRPTARRMALALVTPLRCSLPTLKRPFASVITPTKNAKPI